MTEQIPPTPPSTDGEPATEYPMVAGSGESFDDLDSATPLSVGADGSDADQAEAGPTGHGCAAGGEPE